MITRTGKIAQLPKSIRDDLNHCLENGKQGPELLEWLNALPETKHVLAEKFDNQPITKSNLSDWRQGGFLEWQQDQAREARIQRISESGESLQQAETGDLFENFARIAVAELMADLDGLQKLGGEQRTQYLHNLVRDLARLQNAYNRSRWSALAWTKYNDTPGSASPSARTVPPARCPDPKLETSMAVVPNRAESQAVAPDDSEPKPDGNGMYVLHFTNCDCDEPCPKCHAPDSDYPLDEALPDYQFKKKHFRNPRDRHGKERFLINVACDCFCDRCAEKINGVRPSPAAATSPAKPAANLPPLTSEKPLTSENRCARDGHTLEQPPVSPTIPISPISPIPLDPHADFLRKMAHLKSLQVCLDAAPERRSPTRPGSQVHDGRAGSEISTPKPGPVQPAAFPLDTRPTTLDTTHAK